MEEHLAQLRGGDRRFPGASDTQLRWRVFGFLSWHHGKLPGLQGILSFLYLLLFCDLTVFFLCSAVCTSGIWWEVHRETYSKLKVFISDPSTTMISIIIIIASTTINSTTITIPAPLPLNFSSSLPHQEHHLFQHQKSIQVSSALIPKWCIKSELI